MHASALPRPLGATMILAVTLATPLHGECSRAKSHPPLIAESIGLIFSRSFPEDVVRRAVEQWKSCGDRFSLPRLLVGESGGRTLMLRFSRQSEGVRRCGSITGDLVIVYAYARDERGRPIRCGDPALNLAHELGHAMGLDHSPTGRACRHNIMARIRPQNAFSRNVDTATCRTVHELHERAKLVLRPIEGVDSPG